MINFPFVPNGKLIIFGCPKIWAYCSLVIMCLNIGTPKNIFLGQMKKMIVLGVPILKYLRVVCLWIFCLLP